MSKLKQLVASQRPLDGRVWSGTKSSYWYTWLYPSKFCKALGGKPIEGSLNLWFVNEFRFRRPIRWRAKGAERWSPVWVQPVLLSKDGKKFVKGIALRRGRRDSRAWAEVFAKVRLRKALKLRDNDVVQVWQL